METMTMEEMLEMWAEEMEAHREQMLYEQACRNALKAYYETREQI